jgi:hypothetical protein
MDVEKLVDTYVKGAELVKKASDRQAKLKELLTKAIDQDGEVDDKGHRWLSAGKYVLQRQKRQGARYLDVDKAEEWARSKGIWDEVKVVRESLDPDALAGWVYDNREYSEEYDTLWVTPDPTYAFLQPQEAQQYDY